MGRRSIGIGSVLVVALLAGGCGGGAADGAAATTTLAADAATVSAAILSSLLAEGAGGPFDAASAECAATGFIGVIGVDRLAEMLNTAGEAAVGDPASLFAQMGPDEAAQALSVATGCLDPASAVPATMQAFGFPAEVSTCVGGALAAGGFGEAIVAAFLTGTDPTAEEGFSAAYVGALSGECTTATRQLVIDDLVTYGVGADNAACVADAFVGAANFPEIVAVWMGAADDSIDANAIDDQVTGIFGDCLTAEELAALGIETTATTGGGTTTTP